YQGSKRFLAPSILKYFPETIERLFEPFAGSAAVSIAAAQRYKSQQIVLGDANGPLMDLWSQIIDSPERIVTAYRKLWHDQLGDEVHDYDSTRENFNKPKRLDGL